MKQAVPDALVCMSSPRNGFATCSVLTIGSRLWSRGSLARRLQHYPAPLASSPAQSTSDGTNNYQQRIRIRKNTLTVKVQYTLPAELFRRIVSRDWAGEPSPIR